MSAFTSLVGTSTEIIFDETDGGIPSILHWGAQVGPVDPATLKRALTRQEATSNLSTEPPLSLLPETGHGFFGHPGLEVTRDQKGWATRFSLKHKTVSGASVIYTLLDESLEADLTLCIQLDTNTDVLEFTTSFRNAGTSPLDVHSLATATLPLPPHAGEVLTFEGRWSYEFQTRRQMLPMGQIVQENRKGRTSHDAFPAILAGTKGFAQGHGEVWGCHLGWSGNTRVMAERLSTHQAYLQAGDLLFPGEITLAPGESFEAPSLFASYSSEGLNRFSQNFHAFIRNNIQTHSTKKPRPIHLNTWEAVYFDHSIDRLKGLADKAAAVGVERYVLDDGWFRHRRDDTAGLGDWYVDEGVYPEGLHPLITHVKSKGMEFGLWVEPEMVNPDSDLYRAHPDWVLGVPNLEPILARNQLVLNLTRPDVRTYLFDRLTALLSEYDIAYLKWDMNRDLSHPGSDGIAAVHAQTKSLYGLLADLRAAFPDVEIESCSSGGARPDLGILRLTDRVWASDCNDAHDRLAIQKGAQIFLPLSILGSHVGPAVSHTTGRRHSLGFRALVALFGHMGLELDLSDLDELETAVLKQILEIYKARRNLLHGGHLYHLDTEEDIDAFGVVAQDKSEALYMVAQTDTAPNALPPRIRFAGLDEDRSYCVKLVYPTKSFGSSGSVIETAELLDEGSVLPGRSLKVIGLQIPMQWPDHGFLFELKSEAGCNS